MTTMLERNERDGAAVYPYRNTEGEYVSHVRDWLDALPEHLGIDYLEPIRHGDDARSKAIMSLAQFNAEATGMHWDTLPWRDSDLDFACQAYYVSAAVWRVDWLLHTGLLTPARPEGDDDAQR